MIPFSTAKDDEYSLFEKLTQDLLADSYFKNLSVQGNFYFGKRGTMADIVVWDAEDGIACSDISFELSLERIALYRKIKSIRCRESEEIQNNQMISLTGLNVILSDNEEKKMVTIAYQPIEYRLFHKTLQVWHTAGLNLNQKLTQYTIEKGIYEIPNAMGLAFMVVTADRQLIFTKRSAKRAIRPNEYDCSIVEGLKPEVTSEAYGTYDIYDENYIELEIRRSCLAEHQVRPSELCSGGNLSVCLEEELEREIA